MEWKKAVILFTSGKATTGGTGSFDPFWYDNQKRSKNQFVFGILFAFLLDVKQKARSRQLLLAF